MSENIKYSIASKPSLPEGVHEILEEGISIGFKDGEYDGYLRLSSREMMDIIMPELCEWLVRLDGKVKILDLADNQITSVGACMLFEKIREFNLSIHEIFLNENKEIDDKCMKSLGEYIKSNKSIEKLWLCETRVSDAGVEILASYLDGNTTFRQISLSYNEGVTDKSIPFLIKMIESSHMIEVGFTRTCITKQVTLFTFLACNQLRNGSNRLDFSQKHIDDDGLIKISDAMKKYGIDKLKEIILKESPITSRGASVLFDALRECHSVVSKLDLSNSLIDDECMKQLGEYLQDNQHLEILDLGHHSYTSKNENKITDKAIQILTDHLIGNTMLKVLNLVGCRHITDKSMPYFLEIAKKSCIKRIFLRDAFTFYPNMGELEKLLSISDQEREIPVKSNTKSAAKKTNR